MGEHARLAADRSTFRRLITETEIDIRTSPLARFVGVGEYEAAGGLIRLGLFGAEEDGYMQDAELLESLALEKLNEAVEAIKGEGHAWIQSHTTFDYSDMAEFVRVRTTTRKATEAEQAAMDALDAEMQAIEADFENYDEDADETGEIYAAIEERHNDVQRKMEALSQSLEEPNADDLAMAGTVVTVDRSGALRIERGLIRREDMKKQPKEQGAGTGLAGTGKASHRSRCTRKNSRAC